MTSRQQSDKKNQIFVSNCFLPEKIARIPDDAFSIAARVSARRVADANRAGKFASSLERLKREIGGQNSAHGNTASDDGSQEFGRVGRFKRVGRDFVDPTRRRVVCIMVHIARNNERRATFAGVLAV